jgi:polysaccharide deacetylase family protein (PEP-CTERM system associated)
MNILTFDIEEWYIEQAYHGGRIEKYKKFDNYLSLILDTLEENRLKATFFCLGKMASDFPDVVRKIDSRGHEIGCHSNKHYWLTKMTEKELLIDTRSAVDALEQCIGEKVKSYRAPAFSIGNKNKWAFDVLLQCGIERDASIFPAERDFGGFSSFSQSMPSIITLQKNTLHEYPVSITSLIGKKVTYSGGGYFRFFPLSFILREMKKSSYCMTYFHISDLISDSKGLMSKQSYEHYFKEPGTIINRYKRYIKSNLGTKGTLQKLCVLLRSLDFINIEQADKIIDWSKAPKVFL